MESLSEKRLKRIVYKVGYVYIITALVHTPAEDTTCRLCLNVLNTLTVNTSDTRHTNKETTEAT